MPTNAITRLLFAQGNLCFFCKSPLPKEEASVEHLVAAANGGSNNDANCVACCKSINFLFGHISLKEKIQIILNQKGGFICPNKIPVTKAKSTSVLKGASSKKTAQPAVQTEPLNVVIANLQRRGKARPATPKTLASSITSLFPDGIKGNEVAAIIDQLRAQEKVSITGERVTYRLD